MCLSDCVCAVRVKFVCVCVCSPNISLCAGRGAEEFPLGGDPAPTAGTLPSPCFPAIYTHARSHSGAAHIVLCLHRVFLTCPTFCLQRPCCSPFPPSALVTPAPGTRCRSNSHRKRPRLVRAMCTDVMSVSHPFLAVLHSCRRLLPCDWTSWRSLLLLRSPVTPLPPLSPFPCLCFLSPHVRCLYSPFSDHTFPLVSLCHVCRPRLLD